MKKNGRLQNGSEAVAGEPIRPVSVTTVSFKQLAAMQAQKPTDYTPQEIAPDKKPLVIAYINLQTGVCTKGCTQSEHPRPFEN